MNTEAEITFTSLPIYYIKLKQIWGWTLPSFSWLSLSWLFHIPPLLKSLPQAMFTWDAICETERFECQILRTNRSCRIVAVRQFDKGNCITRKILSSRNRREKIEILRFRGRTSSVFDNVYPGLESNPRAGTYKTGYLFYQSVG
jgi:hypothetical protein